MACSVSTIVDSPIVESLRNFAFIPNNPLALSFPRRRESSKINSPRSGQNLDIDPLRGDSSIDWIPTCAGMTGSALMDNLGSSFHPYPQPSIRSQRHLQRRQCLFQPGQRKLFLLAPQLFAQPLLHHLNRGAALDHEIPAIKVPLRFCFLFS